MSRPTKSACATRGFGHGIQPRLLSLVGRSGQDRSSSEPDLAFLGADGLAGHSRKQSVGDRGQELPRALVEVVQTNRAVSGLTEGLKLRHDELAIDLARGEQGGTASSTSTYIEGADDQLPRCGVPSS